MSLAKYMAKLAADLAPDAVAMKRGGAVRAVRDAISSQKKIGKGNTLHVYDVGKSVVKSPIDLKNKKFIDDFLGKKGINAEVSNAPPAWEKEVLRRLYLKDLLHERGMAPETHLVKTSKRDYLVQPKLNNEIPYSWDEDKFLRSMEGQGFGINDVGSPRNVMADDAGKLQVSDSGLMSFPENEGLHDSPIWGTSPVQKEADRQRARQRRITYNRRGNT